VIRTRAAVARGVIVAIALLVAATLPSASRSASEVSPGVFNEVSTGVAYITTYGCGGRPIAQGSGFLVGDSVVMTARHVVHGACKLRIFVNGERFQAKSWVFWRGGGVSESAADIATIKLDHTAEGAHVFRVRTTLQPLGSNVALVGYPLGSRLSLNQGKIVWRGTHKGAPVMEVRMVSAEGASGAPYIDDQGRVVGIHQFGLFPKNSPGAETSGYVAGLDLVRWWGPHARLDLCRAYPNGGIAGCPNSTPPPPGPPLSVTVTDAWLSYDQAGQERTNSAPGSTQSLWAWIAWSPSGRSHSLQVDVLNPQGQTVTSSAYAEPATATSSSLKLELVPPLRRGMWLIRWFVDGALASTLECSVY
jgi:Trypsin-like peptidase domain